MTTDSDRASNAATHLVDIGENLEDARSRGDLTTVGRIEETIVQDLVSALTSSNDDLAELAVYVLTIVSPNVARTVLDAALQERVDNEESLLEIRLAAQLSGRAASSPGALPSLDTAFRLPMSSGSQYKHPAQPAAPTKLASITTILHGTWAGKSGSQSAWWEPGGNFASKVQTAVSDFYAYSDYFYWSGGNSDAARKQAAADFEKWVDLRLKPEDGKLRLLCHSHGGNVALLAAQNGLEIDKLFLLGTPIRTDYLPRMDNVSQIYCIFSPTDHVQTGGTFGRRRGEGRTLADTPQIRNLVTASAGASHSDLHKWTVWTTNGFEKLL